MKVEISLSNQNYCKVLLCFQMETMYHYTNKKGHDAIKEHGYIAQSIDTVKDAVFGKGIFWFALIKQTWVIKL